MAKSTEPKLRTPRQLAWIGKSGKEYPHYRAVRPRCLGYANLGTGEPYEGHVAEFVGVQDLPKEDAPYTIKLESDADVIVGGKDPYEL